MAEAQKASMNNTTQGVTGIEPQSESNIKDKVNNAVQGGSDTVKEVYGQAKEKAGQTVSQVYGQATEKASEKINEQKSSFAQGLSSLADNLRQMDENLRQSDKETPIAGVTAKYGDTLADQVQRVADYLESKDARAMVSDVEGFARRNPAVFIGGAFAAGLLLARFLKSSGSGGSSAAQLTAGGSGRQLPKRESNQTTDRTDNKTDFKTGGPSKTTNAA